MSTTEKLCLQWNDFKENITSSFRVLREDKELTDVTLVFEDGQQIGAHKVVLASSSPFFMELLKKTMHPRPLIYMRGLRSEDFLAIMDFLYYGEANVLQENLDSFLALAEELRLKGLSGGGADAEKEPDQKFTQDRNVPLKRETSRKSTAPISKSNFESQSSKGPYDTTVAVEGEAEESPDEGDVTGEEDAEKRVLLVVPSDTHIDDSPNKLHKPEPKVLDDDDNDNDDDDHTINSKN